MAEKSKTCLNCGATRREAYDDARVCEVGYWGQDGEWWSTSEWRTHRWAERKRTDVQP